MSDNSGEFKKGLLVGAFVGGTVGALLALLFAPKSGAELRSDIAEKSADYYDKATKYLKHKEEDFTDAVKSTVNYGKERAQNIIHNAKTQADDILKKAEDALKDAKSKAFDAQKEKS